MNNLRLVPTAVLRKRSLWQRFWAKHHQLVRGGVLATVLVAAKLGHASEREPASFQVRAALPMAGLTEASDTSSTTLRQAVRQPVEELPQSSSRGPAFVDGVDIGFTPIGSIALDATPNSEASGGALPPDHAAQQFAQHPTLAYSPSVYHMHVSVPARLPASEFCFRPVYFEEMNLERHGRHIDGLQPAISAARFFATLPALPYLATATPANQCRLHPDPYPAGRPAPRFNELPPLSLEAASVEAGVITGLILLIP